jgi:hypothetical protein
MYPELPEPEPMQERRPETPARAAVAGQRTQPPEPPAYEHYVEPEFYFAGLLICLLGSVVVLWNLLEGELTPPRILTAAGLWIVLSILYLKALQGVRYGTIVRLYEGYVELAVLSPIQRLSKQDIAHFHDKHLNVALRRRIYLYLRAGGHRRLPRVGDPDKLSRGLSQIVGLDRMI